MAKQLEIQGDRKRFKPPDDAVAYLNSLIGRILSISESGMDLNCIGDEKITENEMATILCITKGIFIKNLPVKIMRRGTKPMDRLFETRILEVEFQYSDSLQQRQVKDFLACLQSA